MIIKCFNVPRISMNYLLHSDFTNNVIKPFPILYYFADSSISFCKNAFKGKNI